ncbi:hypothetical protein LAZ67_11002101 [Cordylochernes scorpioides]|uniref:Uncharacterized protein n=1 Tax=Cordylochernes scorpioides TaxID=51811 RepID=A0ABY6KZN0_9ARAC|nr:hypothetical protein LAZ67_11002101 [Cordylochernes scorpioides]
MKPYHDPEDQADLNVNGHSRPKQRFSRQTLNCRYPLMRLGQQIYIYKNECLSVCLSVCVCVCVSSMDSKTIHPIGVKFWDIMRCIPGKVYEKKFLEYLEYP